MLPPCPRLKITSAVLTILLSSTSAVRDGLLLARLDLDKMNILGVVRGVPRRLSVKSVKGQE